MHVHMLLFSSHYSMHSHLMEGFYYHISKLDCTHFITKQRFWIFNSFLLILNLLPVLCMPTDRACSYGNYKDHNYSFTPNWPCTWMGMGHEDWHPGVYFDSIWSDRSPMVKERMMGELSDSIIINDSCSCGLD